MEITVSLDTYKALTERLEHEQDSYDTVIWRLLGNTEEGKSPVLAVHYDKVADWLGDNVQMPVGTVLRRRYKGAEYTATVEERGLKYDGTLYPSLSEAAGVIAEYDMNGWAFWQHQDPKSGRWEPMARLRESGEQ